MNNRIPPPRVLITDGNGGISREWYQYLFRAGIASADIDNIANSIASLAHTAVQPAQFMTYVNDSQPLLAGRMFSPHTVMPENVTDSQRIISAQVFGG